VVAATRAANVQQVPDPTIGNREYMAAIDGIIFGGSPEAGLIRDRVFVHEPLDFLFEVPQYFSLFNGTQQVIARGPDNAAIVFDGGKVAAGTSMSDYLTRVWAKNARLNNLEGLRINGMDAATGTTRVRNRSGTFNAQLVAIRHSGDRVYRFLFLTPGTPAASLDADFRDTMESFRKLTRTDRNRYKPWRINTRVVGRNDTVQSLSRNMPLPGPREEWFRVLNGLAPGSEPFPGQIVKVVVE
jgi:predicted Zn-dependent protease